ncbi:glycosyltransferase family 2 protein [Halomicroarcula sp. GCM10025324]|uniref:glycosyltransferase family 2 protein n=1 Tax=Haloarcula TaxID=2237 RepID=UPI0023E785D7|nr:glycosyltransferase family 2 protein [Halomicroarcula sp. ZS-22-S1]
MAIEKDHTRRTTTSPGAERLLLPYDSEEQPVVSVVLPTLNEEAGIGECMERIETALEELDVPGEVIVSDSSTDRTPEIARENGGIVVKPDKEGYGYAYRYGFQFARGEYIVMGDADTTYDFESIPRLLAPLERDEADIVLGSRFEGRIESDSMPPLHKYVGNPLLTKFLNTFYDAGVTDAHSGFRIFRRELLDDLELRSDGMEFASEMIMSAAENDLRIREVPIVYHSRKGEETLDSFSDGWRHVKFMLLNAPRYLFTVPSILATGVGVLVMLASLLRIEFATVNFGTYTLVAGSLLTVMGYQIGSLAVFSSVASNPIQEPSDPVTNWVRETMSLEQGTLLGLGIFTVGGVATTVMAVDWVSSGYTAEPPLMWLLLAFTVLLVGMQTIFFSFFLAMLVNDRNTTYETTTQESDQLMVSQGTQD